jgi:hypothetical protein
MAQVPGWLTDLEDFFEDCLTSTPSVTEFTAAQAASHTGWVGMSSLLQRYRQAQSGKNATKYVIATYERGRHSKWMILAWPGMTQRERTLAGRLLTSHEIMSVVREEVRPMLRNAAWQFGPAVIRNKVVDRDLLQVYVHKLAGYRSMLLNFRQDVQAITPQSLNKMARSLEAVLSQSIGQVDTWRKYLQTI